MTDSKTLAKTSKFLSYVLRHAPWSIGIKLDENGWVLIDDLLEKAKASGESLDRPLLEEVVVTSDKKRFTIDGSYIRAAQGHSVNVDLGLEPSFPPDVLYHGTGAQNIVSILKTGLESRLRQKVHLSADISTAINVGKRHGKPVVFKVDTKSMSYGGWQFWQADNGVWLTTAVPSKYLTIESFE